ncbi:MAG: DUF3631 domain-containing protein [Verrucomicrobia bacterium]|nr:DUF3631 domain-containing protein [Verrucomicrobiota bacterium]
MLRCHAGCSAESIVSALGLKLADLFPPRVANTNNPKPRIVATYDYTDESGQLLFQCVRFEPKDFCQRHPDPAKPGQWLWNLNGVRRVLYRLPEVKTALAAGRTVFIAEGEKDCDALTKAGFVATCNPMGAGKWHPEYTETLRGAARVVVIADKDKPDPKTGKLNGQEHAQAVGRALHGIAQSVKVIELPDVNGKPVKDAADFFAAGGTADELRAIVKAAPEFSPALLPQPSKPESRASEHPGSESDDEIIANLATLPPLEYERQRDDAAKKLNCRTAILDKLVDTKRPKKPENQLQGARVNLPDVELWSESVNGAEVLAAIAESFARFVVLPVGAADALALWCAHAHSFKSFLCSPRLNISSPEKGCGKTTLRDVVAMFVPRPLSTENLSVAVLFRIVEAHAPTILADEYDAWLRDNEELRGLLNAGHRRGATALRCEGDGNEVRAFAAYAPAVLCGIGALPGTLHDRSIVIRLERAKPSELRERFDPRRAQREHELCRKLARWCADNSARLESADPPLPAGIFNRLADNWRPLFAEAEIAGGDWPARAAAAFAKLTARDDAEGQGIGVMLLADIRAVFSERGTDRLLSKELVEALNGMTDRPWPEANHHKPISQTWLAKRLKPFGVHPRSLRTSGDHGSGYYGTHFAETFARYLTGEGQTNRDAVTTQAGIEDSRFTISDTAQRCQTWKTHESIGSIDLSGCQTCKPPAEASTASEAMLL